MLETGYGEKKRLEYCIETCRAHDIRSILDIGCGTGTHLTYPLARALPEVEIVAMDDHRPSIEYGQAHCQAPNLQFVHDSELDPDRRFDLVIASEVIEHVEDPDGFLQFMKSKMAEDGLILVTTPNGYGPFELASFTHALLSWIGVVDAVKWFVSTVRGRPRGAGGADGGHTLASSPHLNFFGYGQLNGMYARAGLERVSFRNKILLCGYGLSSIIRRLRLVQWNQDVADKVHPRIASGWMEFLKDAPARGAPGYRRGPVARFRRYLNERRHPPGAS